MTKLVITTIAGGLLAASSAVAGDFETKIATTTPAAANLGEVAVGYDSQYNFRGVNLGNDLVTAQFSLDHDCPLTGLPLHFNAWYGSTNNRMTARDFNELDLSLGTHKDLGFATAEVGYIFYHFMNRPGLDDAQEVYFGLSREFFGVNTSLRYFWDIEGDNDGYAELALSKSLNVLYGQSIDLSAALGYLVEEGELSHVTVKASKDFAFGAATLTPYVAYAVELDDLETQAPNQKNELFAGAALSVKF